MLSVIIPTYNRAHLIDRAIKSVLSQSYQDFEIIIVDDCSIDNTEEVIRRFEDERIKYIRHDVPRGGNVARNTGIRSSQGNLIAFLDDDDTWLPTKIEKQVALFTAEEIGAVYCGFEICEIETGRLYPNKRWSYIHGDIHHRLLIRGKTAPTSTYIIRRACFDKVGFFDESLPARQDWDMWIRISAFYHIGCVPEVLVRLGDHRGPRVRSNLERVLNANRLVFEKHSAARRKAGILVQLQAKAAFLVELGTIHVFSGQKCKGAWFYLTSLLYWPISVKTYVLLLTILLPVVVRRKLATVARRIGFFYML